MPRSTRRRAEASLQSRTAPAPRVMGAAAGAWKLGFKRPGESFSEGRLVMVTEDGVVAVEADMMLALTRRNFLVRMSGGR